MTKKNFGNFHIPEDPADSPSLLSIGILLVIVPPITTMIGLYLGYKRIRNEINKKRYQQYRRYANAIGNSSEVSIRGLAASLGMPVPNVVSDLQTMIDEGFIGGNAYIDHSHMTLYLHPNVVETEFVQPTTGPVVNVYINPEDRAATVAAAKATRARRAVSVDAEDEKPAQTQPKQSKAPEPVKSSADSDSFESKLREIKALNEAIDDPAVSQRIDRIGELTASIFRVVREKPEHAEEVRKFMNYYLPTTLKLLKSYSLMEKQSYQGENIQTSRKKIEDVLDTLITAFEQQQDRLFRTEAMDVDADISVLETMMASDGLLEQKGGLRAGGGSRG